MLEQQSCFTNGRLENSQALILQAVWSLEEASTAHKELIARSRKLSSAQRRIEKGAAVIRNCMKKSLSSLSRLHFHLFYGQFIDDFEIFSQSLRNSYYPSVVLKRRPNLRRENALSGRPGIDPRIFQLNCLLRYNILNSGPILGSSIVHRRFFDCRQKGLNNSALYTVSQFLPTDLRPVLLNVRLNIAGRPVKLNLRWSDINSKPEYKLASDTQDENILKMIQSLNEKDVSCEDVVEIVPSEYGGASPLVTACILEPVPSEFLIQHASAKPLDLAITLKQIRQTLEQRYETVPGGVPFSLVEILHLAETILSLERDPTTDCIWNIDHQRHRVQTFGECDIGIAYRERCTCDIETTLENTIHARDPYCPWNIPAQDNELEWDEEERKWKRKEIAVSDSPMKDAAETGEEENGKEEEKSESEEKMAELIAKITKMVGLNSIKEHVQKLNMMIEASARQGVKLKNERFGTVFLGSTGTGKSKLANYYARYLCESDVAGGNYFLETTGAHLANGGINYFIELTEKFEEYGHSGGVLFVDDAHYLVTHSGGKRTLDCMLGEVERQKGKIIFVLAGNEKDMIKLLGGGNGNVSSLLPYVLRFSDFSDEELLELLVLRIKKKFGDKMTVEGGFDGKYMRIAARRLGRKRGKAQFDNARAVQNLFAQIWERQSIRREQARKEKAEAKGIDDSTKENADSKENSEVERPSRSGKEDTPTTEKAMDEKTAEEEIAVEKNTFRTSIDKTSDNDESSETKEDVKDPEYFFTKEDILGPVPSDAILESPAWKKLQRLTGLQAVKESILNILQLSKTNWQRELDEKPLMELTFNRLFLGPPGTGKTVVAKLYGQILAEIGVLSKGELIVRTPTDLIGEYIGDSEANTKSALLAAVGNVLVIDEAYMMYGGGGKNGGPADVFRQGVIDTLVSEVQSVPGEDRCVILLGYADEMQAMLQNSNPGLSRRFPIADAFWFHEFSMGELESILRTKLEDDSLEASEEAIKVAMDVLDKARSRLNFGNGGEVENVITRAKLNYQARIIRIPVEQRPEKWTLEPQDFDPEFDRGKSATLNLKKLFSDVVGCEAIVTKLEQYQRVAQAMKLKGLEPKMFIPTNFVFKGPPGTGKTTTARKIAQVYYDMGMLSEPSVIECSASDLVAQYCGQTGPKTVKALERGLGKVLFIDEAYRLASGKGDGFQAEAISEIVDCLTKPKFFGKIIVILAGYEREMNHLLSINPGLASRFPEEVHFPSMMPKNALQMLKIKLKASKISIPVLNQPESMEYKNLIRLMGLLTHTPSWGNGRDVETLAKTLCRTVFMNIAHAEDELTCTAQMATLAMEALLQERRARTVPKIEGRGCR